MCGKCSAAANYEATAEDKQDGSTDPLDVCRRLTRLELLQLGKLSVEMEKAMLQIRLFGYDVRDIRAAAEQQLAQKLEAKEQERKAHAEHLQRIRAQYDALTLELSKRHGIDDPKCMVVDPETGIIHDSRNI
jgi:uncharacterized membrane protein YccC